MPTATHVYTEIWRSPEGLGLIEADANDQLYMSGLGMNRLAVNRDAFDGWDLVALGENLVSDGVPDDVIDRLIEQAER